MIIKSDFKPAWWLSNPHLQTMWGTIARQSIDMRLIRERIELPDGDFVDIDWTLASKTKEKINQPIVLVLHGLGGSIKSHYAIPILNALNNERCRAAFMHFRGASGVPNRLPRYYHSGDTADVDYVANLLISREPHTKLFAIGFSLGGNVLLKWLGETKNQNPLSGAVAVSVPFELHKAAIHLEEGFSRVYQWRLLNDLRAAFTEKFTLVKPPDYLDLKLIPECTTFIKFDSLLTAPLHGFKDAMDYYITSSCRQYLKTIAVKTLILHAADDPFMTPDVIPLEPELSPSVILELSEYGGHVGFVTGTKPWAAEYWLEKRIVKFITEIAHL